MAHVNDIAFVGSTLVAALRPLGVDARLVEPAHPGAGWSYPAKALTLPLRIGGLAAAGLQLRRDGDDLVHVHYARLGAIGPLSGRPFVLHCHGTDVRGIEPRSPWGELVAPAMRRASLVYYATPDLADDVRRFRPDAEFLPNPVPIPAHPATVDGSDMSDVLIGVRLGQEKGIDTILDVAGRLRAIRPATTFTVIAHGPDTQRALGALGPATRVVAPVEHAAMPSLFNHHRLAIGQFRVGAIGNYELEALASGVPVAARFAYPEAYGSPPPLVEGQSAAQVAAGMAALLDDAALRRSVASAGVDWISTYHAPAVAASRLKIAYERLVA